MPPPFGRPVPLGLPQPRLGGGDHPPALAVEPRIAHPLLADPRPRNAGPLRRQRLVPARLQRLEKRAAPLVGHLRRHRTPPLILSPSKDHDENKTGYHWRKARYPSIFRSPHPEPVEHHRKASIRGWHNALTDERQPCGAWTRRDRGSGKLCAGAGEPAGDQPPARGDGAHASRSRSPRRSSDPPPVLLKILPEISRGGGPREARWRGSQQSGKPLHQASPGPPPLQKQGRT
jgi:hypothetical protein